MSIQFRIGDVVELRNAHSYHPERVFGKKGTIRCFNDRNEIGVEFFANELSIIGRWELNDLSGYLDENSGSWFSKDEITIIQSEWDK